MAVQRLTSQTKTEIKQERFRFLTPLGLLVLLGIVLVIFSFIFELEKNNNEKVMFGVTDASTELYLENIIKTNPESVSSKITLAMIYTKRGKLPDAKALLREAERAGDEQYSVDIKKAKYDILERELASAPYGSKASLAAASALVFLSKEIYETELPKEESDKLKERLCLIGRSNEAVSMIKAECGKDAKCLTQLDKIAKNSIAHGAYRDASSIYIELSTLSADVKNKKTYILKAVAVLESAALPKEALNTLLAHKQEVWDDEMAIKAVELARSNNMTDLASKLMLEYLTIGFGK